MDLMNSHYENRLWKILEKEQLADLSQFHKRGACDEVPLFSRESDIEFLWKEEGRAANAILLQFALKFLKAVIAYEEHRSGYFAAITVWSIAAEPLVPHLFVWCKNVRQLKKSLVLDTAANPFAKQISKLVSRLHLGERFETCQDASFLADATRVFIAPQSPPYDGFLTLSGLRKHTQVVAG
jgi:hypothetical protein